MDHGYPIDRRRFLTTSAALGLPDASLGPLDAADTQALLRHPNLRAAAALAEIGETDLHFGPFDSDRANEQTHSGFWSAKTCSTEDLITDFPALDRLVRGGMSR